MNEIKIPSLEDINALSEKTQYSKEEIIAIFEEKLREIKEKDTQTSNAEKLAWRRTKIEISKRWNSLKNEPVRYIYLFGDSKFYDALDSIRNYAKRMWEYNPQEALRRNLVSPTGEPLDQRKTFYGRIENPNYLMPLADSEHEWRRKLYGLVSNSLNFENVSIGILTAFNNKVLPEEKTFEIWKYYSFQAKERISNPPSLFRQFNVSTGTRLSPIQGIYEPYELLNKLQLIEDYEALQYCKDKHPKTIVPICGVVRDIFYKEGTSRWTVFLGEDKLNVQAWLQKDIPNNLEIGFETVVFGRLRVGKTKFTGGEEIVIMPNAVGYIIRSTE